MIVRSLSAQGAYAPLSLSTRSATTQGVTPIAYSVRPMTTPVFYAPTDIDNEQYLTVDEVAARLGLPAELVLRRVTAGDVPARETVNALGEQTFELRLSDLGLEPDTAGRAVGGVVELTGTLAVSRDDYSADTALDVAAPVAELNVESMVPPPGRIERQLTLIEHEQVGPLSEISGMSIDPRELVAGLLDRWERTLEQRIYAEQRQRFESELVARQTMVKELQMELRAARAEHAAAQAEKDRALIERDHAMQNRERQIQETERELETSRRAAQQAQIQLQAQQTRKRGWFFRR